MIVARLVALLVVVVVDEEYRGNESNAQDGKHS
jgi:hypothetical protein